MIEICLNQNAQCRPPKARLRSAWISFGAFVLFGALAGSGFAQTSAGPPPGDQVSTIPFSDESFGFQMQLPAGWEYDRTRFREWEGSIGLLRGRSIDGRYSLQIMIFRDFKMAEFPVWLERFAKDLAQNTGIKRIEQQQIKVGSRDSAVVIEESQIGGSASRAYYLCVPFDASTNWVFVFTGATPDAPAAELLAQAFGTLAASVRVLYDPVDAEKLTEHLERGRLLIEKLARGEIRPALDGEERWYEITLAGKPIGYMTRKLWRGKHNFSRADAKRPVVKDGLWLEETTWRFAEDGTVRQTRVKAFSSLDRESELFETVLVQIPAVDVPQAQVLVKRDECIREGDSLVSSFSTNMDTKLRDPQRPVRVGPVYLDWTWLRTLPRLLAAEPPLPHAFATYDWETRALLTLLVSPAGKTTLPDGRPADLFELRQGFAEHSSKLYTDAPGNMVRMEAGDLVVQFADPEALEKKFGPLRRAAEDRRKRAAAAQTPPAPQPPQAPRR